MHTANITLVLNGIRATKLKMPAGITAAREAHTTLDDAAKAWNSNYTDLVRAWSKAILANKNPLNDPVVQKQAIAHLLNTQGLEFTVRAIAEDLTVEAIRDNTDIILAAFKDAADGAGKTLTDAHGYLGDLNLDQAATIFKLGANAVGKHTEAVEAVKTIRIIDKAWGALAQLTGFASDTTSTIDRLTDADLATWEKLRRTPDVWEIIQAGGTIDLAITKEETVRRAERHQTDRANRTHTADAQVEAVVRARYGMG